MFGRWHSPPTGARATRRSSAAAARGETLVETLCTLAIVSLGIAALVAAMGYDFGFDHQSRSSANADTLLAAYAGNLQTLTYESCTGSNTPYSATASSALPTQLSGITVIGSGSPSGPNEYLATVTSVQYWNGTTDPIGWTSSCPATGDPGAQRLTVSITPGDGVVTRTMAFVKRSS